MGTVPLYPFAVYFLSQRAQRTQRKAGWGKWIAVQVIDDRLSPPGFSWVFFAGFAIFARAINLFLAKDAKPAKEGTAWGNPLFPARKRGTVPVFDVQPTPSVLYHYRDKQKREIDFVIEMPNGACIGIVLYTGNHTLSFGNNPQAVPLCAL